MVMAALRLVVAPGWFVDAVKATVESKRFIGVLLVSGFAAAYGFPVYVLGISRTGRAYFERRRAERMS